MVQHFSEHGLFKRVEDDNLVNFCSSIKCFKSLFNFVFIYLIMLQKCDPVVEKLYESSEEGKKVTRNNGDKFLAVFMRIKDPDL